MTFKLKLLIPPNFSLMNSPTPEEKVQIQQLMEVLYYPENIEEDKAKETVDQLIEFGVPVKKQNRWIKSHQRYLARRKRIKENASYTKTERLLIVMLAPVSLAFLEGLFVFESDPEYKTMRRQGASYLSLGLALWTAMIIFYSTSLLF